MHKLYSTSKDKFIVYNNYDDSNTNLPHVIFLHGLMSNMNGAKALYLMDYCKKNNYNFIKFDNFGHGSSAGEFRKQTISSWLSGIEIILKELVNDSAILIGSSMGGWIALLAALKFKSKIKGLITLAAAPDFTERLWDQLNLDEQSKLQKEKILEITGKNCIDKYPISYKLIEDARNHLLLTKDKIGINVPVHLIHGILDEDVSYDVSIKLLKKLTSKQIVLKLVKDADHKLSRTKDLQLITNSLEEIMNDVKYEQ